MASSSMSTESSNLFTLARSKLHLSVGKDNCSLHRWVLLKNSIIQSLPLTASTAATDNHVNDVPPPDDGDDDEEVGSEEETDSFLFPDVGKFVNHQDGEVNASEAEWLDSLLEVLGDDEDEFNVESDVHVSILPVDDDEDQLLSPLLSPLSSSDDLVSEPVYYPPSAEAPYPVPYPPFHPPLVRSYAINSFDSSLDSSPSPYDEPLPYHDFDDVEDLSVPDAIEDTSDDESDVPTIPSLVDSSPTSSLLDPASIPLPVERTRRPPLHVYIDTNDSYFYAFELDPLPFPDGHLNSFNPVYQEC